MDYVRRYFIKLFKAFTGMFIGLYGAGHISYFVILPLVKYYSQYNDNGVLFGVFVLSLFFLLGFSLYLKECLDDIKLAKI